MRPRRRAAVRRKNWQRIQESFSCAEKSRKLTRTAWVYLPYDYSEEEQYNILYLSHGGNAANEYMYNALRFFWNADAE